ncbi:hypothetical protein F4821DRAFT_250372 [Hypoxylon rubiginosum]|uniref:Uncharacterized protein n=1 Tax=Hypoxylon rubiginosum TaxID=110542 RepID=A0ACC0CKS4_9PEZI|nr:hypothetical protein F4821DRAFT_250372 [Hypoxylon rubiginosum]
MQVAQCTNSTDPGANGEATLSESQPSLPPVVKSPLNAGEDSMVPSIATTTATANTETAASTEPAAQNDSAINTKEELTEKLEAADKLASQPEKPADNVPEQPAVSKTVTETATTDGPSLPNGEAKEPPKPVTVEEIRDQDMPAAPPAQPSEMTGALPVSSPSDDAAKDEPVKATTETDTAEATTGDKRKASDTEVTNGDVAAKEPLEKAPVEKKQKTNGATTNGAPKKVGRPRKEKNAVKPPPSAGRAARKTRSQGAAD